MNLHLPPYFLPRPVMDLVPETLAAFEAIYKDAHRAPPGEPYRVPNDRLVAPVWQFLCWLAEAKGLVLHGSGDAGIAEFVPRKSHDAGEFGDQCCVYAASDGLWPMYFAVVDRDLYPMSLINGCFRIGAPDADPLYYFSISRHPDYPAPWRTQGTVYVMAADTFEQELPRDHGGIPVFIAHWRSWKPVRPLLQVTVTPDDFPFLSAIRFHDAAAIQRRSAGDPNGWPWEEAE